MKLSLHRKNHAQPTLPGGRWHTRPLYLGLGRLVSSSVTGRLRSSTYRELTTPGYARQRVRFGLVEELDALRDLRIRYVAEVAEEERAARDGHRRIQEAAARITMVWGKT